MSSSPVRWVVITVAVLALGACGDSDESAEDRYCAAGDDLRTAVDGLADVDVVQEGLDGVESAFDEVRSSLGELRDAGADVADDEIDALGSAVDELSSSLDGLGSEGITQETASSVVSAIDGVGQAAGAVFSALTDTCE